MRLANSIGALLALLWLAARTTAAALPAPPADVDPLARPDSRIGPHYAVWLGVSVRGVDEAELCGQFALDADGRLALTLAKRPLDRVPLSGLTASEARERVYRTLVPYYASPPDVRLAIAHIPRIKVTVRGSTFRNEGLELVVGSHLSDALAQTGYVPGADLAHVRIDRFAADGQSIVLTADFGRAIRGDGDRFSNPVLENGDTVTVPILTVARPQPAYQVQGEVRSPGRYVYKPDMTVRDAIDAAHGMLPSADPTSVLLIHADGIARSRIDASRAIQGIATDDLPMAPGDLLLVAKKDTGQAYAIVGEVVNPQTFEYRGKAWLKQAIVDCGGFKPDADEQHLVLSRNLIHDPAHPDLVSIDYAKLRSGEQPDIELRAGDVVQVPARHKSSRSPWLDLGLMILRRLLLPF